MPERILVVAAHFPWLNSIGRTLIEQQFQVLVAMTAREAMGLAVREVPDLIVIDPELPDMDGLDLCQQLRTHATTAHVPVIVVTRREGITHRLAAFMAGADDCLSRPVDLRELVARVRAILRRTTRRPPSSGAGPRHAPRITRAESRLHGPPISLVSLQTT